MTDSKLYSLAYLQDVSGGNEEFIKQMISLFLEITPPQIQELKEGIDTIDFEGIGKVAHGMKPSIIQMKIKSGESLIKQIETESKQANDIEALSQYILELENTLEKVFIQLENELK